MHGDFKDLAGMYCHSVQRSHRRSVQRGDPMFRVEGRHHKLLPVGATEIRGKNRGALAATRPS